MFVSLPPRARHLAVASSVALGLLAATAAHTATPASVVAEQNASFEQPGGVYSGRTLYVDPNDNNYAEQAEAWRTSRPDDARIMDELAQIPTGTWIGDWGGDIATLVDQQLDEAGDQLRVFVVYNIPSRDCGFYSAGGAGDRWNYDNWIAGVAAGLQGREAIVVLEPDGLALDDCLDDAGRAERHDMIAGAVDTLTAAGAKVYIDAGDSNWIPAAEMAQRLLSAGVQRAAGFALNVSHTEFTEDEIAYAEEIRAIVGPQAHYVIDTGRNGLGPSPDNEWCNPLERANGPEPTLNTGTGGLDALLWIKPPGESDGDCHGGPPAGHWWPEYALDLAIRAGR